MTMHFQLFIPTHEEKGLDGSKFYSMNFGNRLLTFRYPKGQSFCLNPSDIQVKPENKKIGYFFKFQQKLNYFQANNRPNQNKDVGLSQSRPYVN